MLNRDIPLKTRATCAVDHAATADEEVVHAVLQLLGYVTAPGGQPADVISETLYINLPAPGVSCCADGPRPAASSVTPTHGVGAAEPGGIRGPAHAGSVAGRALEGAQPEVSAN